MRNEGQDFAPPAGTTKHPDGPYGSKSRIQMISLSARMHTKSGNHFARKLVAHPRGFPLALKSFLGPERDKK